MDKKQLESDELDDKKPSEDGEEEKVPENTDSNDDEEGQITKFCGTDQREEEVARSKDSDANGEGQAAGTDEQVAGPSGNANPSTSRNRRPRRDDLIRKKIRRDIKQLQILNRAIRVAKDVKNNGRNSIVQLAAEIILEQRELLQARRLENIKIKKLIQNLKIENNTFSEILKQKDPTFRREDLFNPTPSEPMNVQDSQSTTESTRLKRKKPKLSGSVQIKKKKSN